MSARPNLHLVTPDLIRGPASFDPSELAPAECDQLAREPYVADWMIAEGEQALRDRKAVRRLRWTIRAIVALSFVSAAWALKSAL